MEILEHLLTFNVSVNNMTGLLPSELGLIIKNNYFTLYENNLINSIPTNFVYPVYLSLIEVHSIAFSGPLPSQLGVAINIKSLFSHGNQSNRSIPIELVK